jgi:hypothetical protein
MLFSPQFCFIKGVYFTKSGGSQMVKVFNLFTPVLALVALAMFAGHVVKADDSATSQPSANGGVTVTVLDSDGNAAAKVSVQIFAQKPAADSDADAGAKPKKGKALARGRTDSDGKYTFSGLADGDYRIAASVKKTGAKGSGTASVTDSASSATVTINLSAGNEGGGNGGATTAPSQN